MNLTVSGFVGDLIEMYPKAFINPQKWIERYTEALNEVGTIDFKKLWKIYDNEYLSTVTPPPVKWVKDAAMRAKVHGFTSDKYKTITAVDSNGIYEFAYPEGSKEPNIEKEVKDCLFWWHGTYWDCPEEYKNTLAEIVALQKEKILKGKPKQAGNTQDLTLKDIFGVEPNAKEEKSIQK